MSTSDFSTKVIYDSVLNDVSDSITYAIRKGAADRTYQRFNANSASSSSVNFTVNPPSESTVVDRDVIISSKVRFQLNIGDSAGAGLVVDTNCFQYGLRESLQSFPLNRLFTTSTLSVNNVSTSVNNSDILPALLRCLPEDFMQCHYGLTPTLLDRYGLHQDNIGRNNNVFADYGEASYNEKLLPRGSHSIKFIVPDGAGNEAGINRYIGGVRQDNSPISTGTNNYWIIGLEVELAEPLFVSPMLFGDPKFNDSGFLGVNNFQLVLSVDSQMRRFWSSGLDKVTAGKYTLKLLSNNPFEDMQLQMCFLTAPLPLVLPPKSVLPYMNYIAYSTSQNSSIAEGAEQTYTINSLQLEVVPDKLIVYIRQKLADQSPRSADSFLEIKNVSITFANKSGLLSNASQNQIFKLSKKNNNYQSWYSWKGLADKYTSIDPYQGNYATTGSVMVIDPVFDLGLGSPALSAGSIGQFNLMMSILAKRNVPDHPDKVGFVPEIVVIACRSGYMATSSGSSTVTTNMLNSQIVTDALESDREPMGSDQYQRLIGGAGSSSDMPAEMSKGGARSGGARSGGVARSGGKYSKLSSLAM